MALTIVNNDATDFKKTLLASIGDITTKSEKVKIVYGLWEDLFIPFFEKTGNIVINEIEAEHYEVAVDYLQKIIGGVGECGSYIDDYFYTPDVGGWSSTIFDCAMTISHFYIVGSTQLDNAGQMDLISNIDVDVFCEFNNTLMSYWIPFEVVVQIRDIVTMLNIDCASIAEVSNNPLELKRLLMQVKKRIREGCIALSVLLDAISEITLAGLFPLRTAISTDDYICVTRPQLKYYFNVDGENNEQEEPSLQTGTEVPTD